MAAKLLILAALVACANAGFLSLGYGGNGQQASNNNGGYLNGNNAGNAGNNGAGTSNYYNNAPLALSHGPLPQSNPQPVVAPLRYAPNPPPLATSASFRHQISHSQPAQLQVSSGYNYAYGNLGNQGGSSAGLGAGFGGNNNNNNGFGGYGYNNGLNGGNGYTGGLLSGGNGYNNGGNGYNNGGNGYSNGGNNGGNNGNNYGSYGNGGY